MGAILIQASSFHTSDTLQKTNLTTSLATNTEQGRNIWGHCSIGISLNADEEERRHWSSSSSTPGHWPTESHKDSTALCVQLTMKICLSADNQPAPCVNPSNSLSGGSGYSPSTGCVGEPQRNAFGEIAAGFATPIDAAWWNISTYVIRPSVAPLKDPANSRKLELKEETADPYKGPGCGM